MILQGANFLVMAIGGFYFYPRLIGTVLNTLMALTCHLPAIIMAFCGNLIGGLACTLIPFVSEYDGEKFVIGGHTYSDDGKLILYFALVQSLLVCMQLCCCWCPLRWTPIAESGKPNEKRITVDMSSSVQAGSFSESSYIGEPEPPKHEYKAKAKLHPGKYAAPPLVAQQRNS